MRQTHTLVVLVEDQPGVLNRVVSLMRRRSFNIDSITVGHSEQPGLSRMTIIVTGEDNELYKLLEVVKVTDVPAEDAITRELVIVKVAAKGAQRAEVMQIAEIYSARILDATPNTLMIQATGNEDHIDSFLNMMRIFGIREMARSGKIAMSRGSSSKQGRIDRIGDGTYAVAD
jgi:acetolactate synthase-1/3 small subunit